MRLALLIATVFFALPVAAQAERSSENGLQAQLIALERQSWAAWQDHDVRFWRTFLSDDHVEVDNRAGAVSRDAVVGVIGSGICVVAGYELGHFTFRQFDRTTALLVYRAAQTTSCNGVAVPSPVWATSLYEFRRGRWVNVLYGQTPIPTPRSPSTPSP